MSRLQLGVVSGTPFRSLVECTEVFSNSTISCLSTSVRAVRFLQVTSGSSTSVRSGSTSSVGSGWCTSVRRGAC